MSQLIRQRETNFRISANNAEKLKPGAKEVYGCFYFTQNNYGDIIDIECDANDTSELEQNEDVLMEIAPYVNDGSFIEFGLEEGDLFRYVFHNGQVKKIEPVFAWEEV